jgi:hypothetical protein
MKQSCRVFRGLVKEVEEEINHFLSNHEVRVVHMAQSETGNHISVTLLLEIDEAPSELQTQRHR